MSFNGFPITLNLLNKPCLVIGGGPVAERKVKSLLAADADTTVISPALTKELNNLATAKKFKFFKRHYKNGDLNGYFLTVVAIGDARLNKVIYRNALAKNILINIADAPELCTFFLPAVVKRGELQIAVSTGGKSPALAKRLRERLEKEFGPEYEEWLSIISEYRRRIMLIEPDKKKRHLAYEKLLNSNVLEKISNLGIEDRKKVSKKIDIDKLIAKYTG